MRNLCEITPVKRSISVRPDLWGRGLTSLFSDYFGEEIKDLLQPFGDESKNFVPKINVEDSGKAVTVSAELPGMEEKDITITLADGYLKLSGEKKFEEERKEGSTWYRESRYGSFERVVPLGKLEIDHDKIVATMTKGILVVTLPKSESAQKKERTISIKRQD